jgi:hypothetical protein
MFEILKRLYLTEKLDHAGLRKAVEVKKWISEEQYKEIKQSA